MSYGQVIKMHDGSFNTPNKGVLVDLETGLQYTFARESYTGVTRNWNVKLHDVVTFTINGSTATGVTLEKKHVQGFVYSVTPSTLLTGLVAYWEFDESSGNAIDLVGGNTGVATNITYNEAGKIGKSLKFNGTSSYLAITEIVAPSSFSFSVWIKWDSSQSNSGSIFASSSSVRFYVDTGSGIIIYYQGAAYPCSTALSNGVWTLLTVVVESNLGKFYINGSFVNNIGVTLDNQEFNRIGYSYGTNYFKGNLDTFIYWNKALSSSEVTALYNEGSGLAYPF